MGQEKLFVSINKLNFMMLYCEHKVIDKYFSNTDRNSLYSYIHSSASLHTYYIQLYRRTHTYAAVKRGSICVWEILVHDLTNLQKHHEVHELLLLLIKQRLHSSNSSTTTSTVHWLQLNSCGCHACSRTNERRKDHFKFWNILGQRRKVEMP